MAPSEIPREAAPARAVEEPTDGYRQQWSGDLDRAWIMTVELVAATFTWGGIGWLADRLFGTAPWLMLAGFVLGNATGIYLVWVRSSADEEAERARRAGGEREPGGEGSSA